MKVLIAGLIDRQERHIVEICPPGIELAFITVDCNLQEWVHAAQHADVAILVTKFVSHKHYDSLKKGSCRIILHRGGIGGLKELVRSLKP